MSDQGPFSPEALEAQIEETRHHLSDTLEELRRRLASPDVYADAFTLLRANEGTGRAIAETVRQQPVPVGLIGLGLTWLIASTVSGGGSQSHSAGPMRSSQGSNSTSSQRSSEMKEKMDEAKSRASDAAESVKGKMQDAKSNLAGTAQSTKSKLSRSTGRTQHGGSNMKERYENARYKSSEAARNMREGYQQRTHQMRHQANSLIEERPLALVAIGFGVGAALGLMLPSTERENRLMGDARDNLKERVTEEGHEQFERAREKVEAAAEAAREKVQEETDNAGTGNGKTEAGQPSGRA